MATPMKTLMFYELAPEGLAQVPAHFPAHQQRLLEFKSRGTLLMAGPYGVPPIGALAVFTDEAAAREFAREDPFVLHGIVASSSFHPWDEGLSS
jgi:uncharacterized protein YciI